MPIHKFLFDQMFAVTEYLCYKNKKYNIVFSSKYAGKLGQGDK